MCRLLNASVLLVLMFTCLASSFAQSSGTVVLKDWSDWVANVRAEKPSVRLTCRNTVTDSTMVYMTGGNRDSDFYWSHRYPVVNEDFAENVVAGNSQYIFNLAIRSKDVKLAALTLLSDSNYGTARNQLIDENPFLSSVLLSSVDGLQTLCATGSILKEEFPATDIAILNIKPASINEDDFTVKNIKVHFSRQQHWHPTLISWTLINQSGESFFRMSMKGGKQSVNC